MSARYEVIAGWVNEFGWTQGAELGVSDGRTFIYLLDHCPDLCLIGIDIWDVRGTVPGPTASKEICWCPYCAETRAAKRDMPMWEREAEAREGAKRSGDRATLYKMDTVEAAKGIAEHSLDFVFVDGDHSADGVFADISAWKSKVKSGGRVIGHDWNFRSVRNGVCKAFMCSLDWEDTLGFEDDHIWFRDV